MFPVESVQWHTSLKRIKAQYAIAVGTKLMIVISRRPSVTVVAKRDTSNENVRASNNLKREKNVPNPQGREKIKWVDKDQYDEDSKGVYMV